MVLGMQLPAYLGHFGLGIALGRLWLAHRARPATTRWRANRLLVVGAAAALLVGSMSGVIRLPDEHVRMVPTLALGLLLFVAVTSRNAPVRAALGAGPLAFVGKVSYSAYLCHLPVIAIWGMHPSVFPGWLSLPGYLAFVLAVSWMSWRWIEQPYLRPRTRRAGKRAFVELPLSGEEPAPSPASESRR
jgi:peptidoglycan/LPS O-acetylase OafA/YrhL